MAATITAFGAIIGYLGAEVGETPMIERVLWPQRYQNYLDLSSFIKLSLLMTTSGPLHRAALETLDRFRDHGLYRGFLRGDVLGTPFFPEQPLNYYHRTAPALESRDEPKPVRNGFWVQVLKEVERRRTCAPPQNVPGMDREAAAVASRATRSIFQLSLNLLPSGTARPVAGVDVSEAHVTAWTVLGIVASELPTVLIAVATGLWYRFGQSADDKPEVWLAAFLCIPLLLKLAAALLTVRREDFTVPETLKPGEDPTEQRAQSPGSVGLAPDKACLKLQPEDSDAIQEKIVTTPSEHEPFDRISTRQDIVEVDSPLLGFALISTKSSISSSILPFFRHYGHPIRHSYRDRLNETINIIIVYAFVFYFPAGLFASAWMNIPSQYVWLGHQVYCVAAMHIARLAGWQSCSRTEERVAKLLLQNKTVYLVGGAGCVQANLAIEDVPSMKAGKARVKAILQQNDEP